MALRKPYVAQLTLWHADEYSEQGVKEIAEWLRHCADSLLKEHKCYAKKFVARYYVVKQRRIR